MIPVEPRECEETVPITFAKDQPEYLPLPARVDAAGRVTTEWELSAEELAVLLDGGRICLTLWTFNQPLQPVQISVVEAPCPTEVA